MDQLLLQLFTVIVLATCAHVTSASFRSWTWSPLPHARLAGHVMETKMATSLLSCLSLCGRTSGCRTVNHREQDGACELNSADDQWSDVTPAVYDVSFAYYKRKIPKSAKDVDAAFVNQTCAQGHLLLDNRCHEVVVATTFNFSYGLTFCRHKYGRLAILDNAPTQGICTQLLPFGNYGKYYINMVRNGTLASDMYWGNGVKASLARPPWAPGAPDKFVGGSGPEDCGCIEPIFTTMVEFFFNDVPCNLNDRGVICQYDPYVHLVW